MSTEAKLRLALNNCAAALRYVMTMIPSTDPFCIKVEATEKAARAALALPSEPDLCKWTENGDEDESDGWNTGCGHKFVLIEGTPADNGMKFCCYCGGKLERKET